MNRRKFLQAASAVGAAALPGILPGCERSANSQAASEAAQKSGVVADFATPLPLPGPDGPLGIVEFPRSEIMLTASPTGPHPRGPTLGYQGVAEGKRYWNPIIRVNRGDVFAASLKNGLDRPTIIHWHGLHVPDTMDGHPSQAIASGGSYRYRYRILNRAGTYWYHPHPHGDTARQAYLGLASFYIVEDDEERALQRSLGLRLGQNDLPLVLQDRRSDSNGNWRYAPSRMERMMGLMGDTTYVNFAPKPSLKVASGLYRLRLLNGSNARIYKLALTKAGAPVPYWIIGTDGGLLDKPYKTQAAFLAPAERIDMLVDLSGAAVGESILLQSLAFDPMQNMGMGGGMGNMGGMGGGMGGMGGGMGGMGGIPQGSALTLMKFTVDRKATQATALPARLSDLPALAEVSYQPRNIRLSMAMMQWQINGQSFRMGEAPIEVRKGTVEAWDIANADMSMPHPMHMHGFQFRVASRQNSPDAVRKLSVDGNGRMITDLGWKDTVLAWPGETVRIVTDFSHPFPGDQTYLFHCHNLDHEDSGMMVNYKVRDA